MLAQNFTVSTSSQEISAKRVRIYPHLSTKITNNESCEDLHTHAHTHARTHTHTHTHTHTQREPVQIFEDILWGNVFICGSRDSDSNKARRSGVSAFPGPGSAPQTEKIQSESTKRTLLVGFLDMNQTGTPAPVCGCFSVRHSPVFPSHQLQTKPHIHININDIWP